MSAPVADTTPDDGPWRAAEAVVRDYDPDRFLAARFVPDPPRRYLDALHAFSIEIARVRETVSDPMPGEIRLQWWRDALTGAGRGDVARHPVARATIDTVTRHRLPVAALVNLIEARVFDLYDDPMPTLNDLEGYCGETASALIQLGAIVLMGGEDPGAAEVAGHAGVAYGLTGLLRALPVHARRGQVYLPLDVLARHGVRRDDVVAGSATPQLLAALTELRARARHHLDRTRALIGTVPKPARPAFLPVALVEPHLRLMDRPDYAPFRRIVELPAWRRSILLWQAARRSRRD